MCVRSFQDIAALQTAKQVAEQTQHAALADAIDRQLLARWLAGFLNAFIYVYTISKRVQR